MKTKTKTKTVEKIPAEVADDDLPDGWKSCTIGDIATIVGGGTPQSGDETNFSFESGIPWITPADLSGYENTYISSGKRFLTEKGYKDSSAKMLPAGAVLFSSRAPIGYVAIAANAISTNQGFKSFICSDTIQPEFLYFWLKFAKPLAEELASGTTFSEISGANAKLIPFKFPPLSEQHRIVAKLEAILDKVTSCRERLAKIPALLKRFRQAILANACSGKLTEDWREKNPKVSITSHNQNTTGAFDIPESWEWTAFSNVSREITVGYVGPMAKEYVEQGIPFLRSLNVRRFAFDPHNLRFISRKFHEKIIKSRLSPGDVAIVRSGNVGIACVIPETLREANCSDLVILRPSSKLLSQFACIFLNSTVAQSHINSVKVGIAQGHFNVGSMKTTLLPLPPLSEQREIVRRVEVLFAFADRIESRLALATANVEKLTQSVLTKAFRGELVQRQADATDKVFSENATRRKANQITLQKLSKPDKAACALFLDIVSRNPGISTQDHTKLWVCGIAPQTCKDVLDNKDLKRFAPVLKKTIYKEPPGLWAKFRSLLEREYITVDRSDNTQKISPGPRFKQYPKELQMTSYPLLAEFAEKVMVILKREENSTKPSPSIRTVSAHINSTVKQLATAQPVFP